MFPGAAELGWFLDWAINLGRRRGDRVDAAVTAVGKALVETKLYLEALKRDGRRTQSTEDDIVRFWTFAAESLRHVDKDFARMASMKAQYWLDPERWLDRDPTLSQIAIDKFSLKYYDLQDVNRPILREIGHWPVNDTQ